ncbi:hypothetical protein HHL22_11290 [Hymenobacter sp. RP-2-7]|uniref:Uncharacterized protein n=1 Tax=Hymenobacter polaris TaxID=2682546 RepID=A0A7Y0FMU7_9BACT|nr:hypothetical protein [Hymenobacter polaris]NML65789.1 hypothetical protein [Hymenobacter polaris]
MANNPPSQAPADGSDAATPANKSGVNPQQQGSHQQTKPASDSAGHHGGNHGNDVNDEGAPAYSAKGSSHAGTQVPAANRNDGGGSDQEHKNETKNTTAYNSEYGEGNAASSSANDGGKIGDADNPA